MQTQKISVIMAAYNSERFIGEAIASVVRQTYDNWELIIVDDCSTDNTATEIKKYTDKRIVYLKNDENKGAAYSRNRAIKAAKGEFIAILDADDCALPQRFSTQVEFLNAHAGIDAAGSFVLATAGIASASKIVIAIMIDKSFFIIRLPPKYFYFAPFILE
jgi:glycosyltransferase involved in cell wall biosynthesis